MSGSSSCYTPLVFHNSLLAWRERQKNTQVDNPEEKLKAWLLSDETPRRSRERRPHRDRGDCRNRAG